jgi:hypothetical protein
MDLPETSSNHCPARLVIVIWRRINDPDFRSVNTRAQEMCGEIETTTATSQEEVASVLGEGKHDNCCSMHENLIIMQPSGQIIKVHNPNDFI